MQIRRSGRPEILTSVWKNYFDVQRLEVRGEIIA